MNTVHAFRRWPFLAIVSAFISLPMRAEPLVLSLTPGTLQRPAGVSCTAHVVSPDGLREQSRPCGQPIEIDRADSKVWLEVGDWITPYSPRAGRLHHGLGDAAELEVIPGGYVTLEGWDRAGGEVVLMSYPGRFGGARIQPALIRPAQTERTLMPSGSSNSVVALVMGANGSATALSHPTVVKAGSSVEVGPARIDSGSHILLRFGWDEPEEADSLKAISIALSHDQKPRPADVLLRDDVGGIAIWYDAAPGKARIELTSDEWHSEPVTITIPEGRVLDQMTKLQRKPDLSVIANLMRGELTEDEQRNLELTLRMTGDTTELHEIPITLDREVRIEALPLVPFDVALAVGTTHVLQRVDLTDGESRTIRFDLSPIVVTGTVTFGGDETEAKIAFDDAEFKTDFKGEYRATLWQPRRYRVTTKISAETDIPAMVDLLMIDDDLRLDIDVPRNRVTVRVTDTVTGKPVGGSSVRYQNRWTNSDPQPELRSRNTSTMGEIRTDAEGTAPLPPLREGTLNLAVQAEGFDEWVRERLTVTKSMTRHTFEAALRPVSKEPALRILLPSGRPASHATIFAMRNGSAVWRGEADVDGTANLPIAAHHALLAVRHPEAAIVVREWSGEEDTTWQLPPSAPPLTVRLQDSAGNPAIDATVVVWIGGVRFTPDAPLPFIAPVGRGAGIWPVTNLPQVPLRLVALSAKSSVAADSPAIDALATTIPYPWPPSPVVIVLP